MKTVIAALAGIFALGALSCGRAGELRPEPPGAELYATYCASCHGADGRGHGPVAPALRTPPSDLTALARRNGGRFDDRAVLRAIDGGSEIEAHGTREMPVWGAVFQEELSGRPYAHYVTLLHAQALTDYLASIQEP